MREVRSGHLTVLTRQAVVYHVPPFVVIEDSEGTKGDPGNVAATRTADNGKISGLT